MRRRLLSLVFVTACGDGLEPVDAPAVSEGDHGLVSIQFFSDSALQGDQIVYFQRADSSLIQAVFTDDSGRASGFMDAPGFVTVVARRGMTQFLYTYADVQPGDELVIDERDPQQISTTFQIRVAPAASTSYQLGTSCGSQRIDNAAIQDVSVTLTDCGGAADMLVTTPVGYLYREDVPVASGTTVIIDGTYRPAQDMHLAVTNAPVGHPDLTATVGLVKGARFIYIAGSFLDLETGSAEDTFRMPLPPDATLMTRVDPSSPLGLSAEHIVAWSPASTETVIDYGASVSRALTERPVFDPARRGLRWAETPGATPDGVMARFGWFIPETGRNYNWTILSPRGDEPFLELPFFPRPDLTPQGSILEPYIFVSFTVDGGYARINGRLIGSWTPERAWPADGPAGKVAYTSMLP